MHKISSEDSFKLVSKLEGPILVIGSSGFIGANLFKLIYSNRDDVYASIRADKGWRLEDVPDSQTIILDIHNLASIKEAINRIKPKVVFNCSSFGAYSFEEDQSKIYETNITGTINLVNILEESNISAYIHAGSSSEYGINSKGPSEDDFCVPNSDYAISKLAASNYINFIGKKNDFPGASLRLYSVYGPLEDSSRLVPKIIEAGLKKQYPNFVNKDISRDFVYISDVCNAFLMAAVEMNPSMYGEIFNIGTGIETNIEKLAGIAQTTFKIEKNPEFGIMPERKWDLTNWYSNSQKAKTFFNWVADTSIKDGLEETISWNNSSNYQNKASNTKQNTKQNTKSISAIIACYKDEEAIPVMYAELTSVFKNLDIDYEIIFVNDCSPDSSKKLIQDISNNDSHVIGINHSRNFGSQMAFISGMEISSKDSVVLLDGDLQDPPHLIAKFYAKWIEGYDVVYGRRVKRDMKRIVEFQYKMFYRIFSKFSYLEIPRDAGDFSLIDRNVVNLILSFPERDLFLRGIRAYVGFNQIGVDYLRPERRFGSSTNNFFKNIDWAKKGIFSFSNSPLAIVTSSGFVLVFLSFLTVLTFIILRILFPDIAPKGATSILVSIFTFGSLNLLAIGILGEYIGKILIEVKQRPRLIRESITRNGKEIKIEE